MSFLAFVLENSGCIRRMRSIWLSIFLIILFNLFIRKVFDENSFICCFFHLCRCHVDVWSVYYIYIFNDAQVNLTSSKNTGSENTAWWELNDLNLINYYMLYNLTWLHKHLALIKFVSFNRHFWCGWKVGDYYV